MTPSILRVTGKLMPNAEPHTPYGMTEVLPVADISLAEIDAAGTGRGVCVGFPLPAVEVAIELIVTVGAGVADIAGPVTVAVELVGVGVVGTKTLIMSPSPPPAGNFWATSPLVSPLIKTIDQMPLRGNSIMPTVLKGLLFDETAVSKICFRPL